MKPKVVYLRPFLSSLSFRKFWKQNFVYFGHKHVETGPNCSYEVATFVKYHMPLNRIIRIERKTCVNISQDLLSLWLNVYVVYNLLALQKTFEVSHH